MWENILLRIDKIKAEIGWRSDEIRRKIGTMSDKAKRRLLCELAIVGGVILIVFLMLNRPIEGTWKCITEEQGQYTVTFFSDGTLYFDGRSGSYVAERGRLLLIDPWWGTAECEYRIFGNRLTITYETQILEFVRAGR